MKKILILFMGALVLTGCFNSDKEENKNNNNTQGSNSLFPGTLFPSLKVDEVEANEALNAGLYYALDKIVNVESKNLPYDSELLNSLENKYRIAWFTMFANEKSSKYFVEGLKPNASAVKKEAFKKYYKNMYNEELDEAKLNDISGVSYDANYIYDSIPTMAGEYSFVLKMNKNERKGTSSILYVDFLTAFVNGTNEIDYNLLNNYRNASIKDGYESLVSAKLRIEYKTSLNGYVLKSVRFERN